MLTDGGETEESAEKRRLIGRLHSPGARVVGLGVFGGRTAELMQHRLTPAEAEVRQGGETGGFRLVSAHITSPSLRSQSSVPMDPAEALIRLLRITSTRCVYNLAAILQ